MIAVLVDIDDTLVDLTSARRDGLRAHLSTLAPELASGEGFHPALTQWRQLEREHVDRFLRGETSLAEQRRTRVRAFCLAHRLPQQGSDEQCDAWYAQFQAHCDAVLRPFPDVAEALDELRRRGVTLGALSNNVHAVQELRLRRVKLRDRISALLCCDDLGGASKPDPQAFHAACAALGSAPERTVLVGDDREVDARGAAAAGLIRVWLDRTADPHPPADVPTVASLTGLVDWLDAAALLPARTSERCVGHAH